MHAITPLADNASGGTELRVTHGVAIPLHGPDTLASFPAFADRTQGCGHRLGPASAQFVAALVHPRSDRGVGPAGSCRDTGRRGSSAWRGPTISPVRGRCRARRETRSWAAAHRCRDARWGWTAASRRGPCGTLPGTPLDMLGRSAQAGQVVEQVQGPGDADAGRRVADHARGSRRGGGAYGSEGPIARKAPRLAGRAMVPGAVGQVLAWRPVWRAGWGRAKGGSGPWR